jgi:hypothetical protein
MNNKISTTASNRPHKPAIHYSAKGYDEYRADLISRLGEKGFALKEDEQDFLNAFVDLTAYLGDVLMTYQNAHAQEIYRETAQLRESLFGLASMVDYRIHPGSAAMGTLVIMAKPGKAGLLPKGFQVSGKEEQAKEAVVFETDAALQIEAVFNDFTLAESERFNEVTINTSSTEVTITLQEKTTVIPGQYLYCKIDSPQGRYFAQVQSAVVNDEKETTKLTCTTKHSSTTPTFDTGAGTWGLVHNEPRGIYALAKVSQNTAEVWLDNKYEDIVAGSPIIMRENTTVAYGSITEVFFESIYITSGTSTRTSEVDDHDEDAETVLYCNTVILDMTTNPIKEQNYYIIQKKHKEIREVCKVSIEWLGDYVPSEHEAGSGNEENPAKKASTHFAFIGIQTPCNNVETTAKNTRTLKGKNTLEVCGDFSTMEKYRTLLLHEPGADEGMTVVEEAGVLSVSYDANIRTSTIMLRKPIVNDFTMHGVKIWGNVVKATQGKTVNETILGSGRGEAPYQAFDLPKAPLTFVMYAKEGLQGAIDLTVNGLPWQQKDDLMNSLTGDRHYAIETDYASKSRVLGSRLPTGRDNVVAKFRIGQGTSGNVSPGILKKAASKPPFLDGVFNPEKTAGGTDPDTEEQLRERIPTQHITFDRAVSLQDYADLMLTCPGISKAKSGWRWMHNRQYVVVAVAGGGNGDVSPEVLNALRGFLDARRDPNQPLIVKQVDIISLELAGSVVASPGYDKEKVKDAIYAALGTEVNEDGTQQFFNFDRLGIGMSIHRKDIYRVIENIPGVKLVERLELARSFSSDGFFKPSFCPGDVWINNWELPKLDAGKCFIEVTEKPAASLCEKAGG